MNLFLDAIDRRLGLDGLGTCEADCNGSLFWKDLEFTSLQGAELS